MAAVGAAGCFPAGDTETGRTDGRRGVTTTSRGPASLLCQPLAAAPQIDRVPRRGWSNHGCHHAVAPQQRAMMARRLRSWHATVVLRLPMERDGSYCLCIILFTASCR